MDICDAPHAALLSNERQRHILLALVERERSQSELAEMMAMPLSLLHYHLARLARAKLIVLVGSRARAGRAIKYYRAAARSFFVPAELAAPVPDPALFEELRHALEKSRAGTYRGILYSYEDGPRMRVVQERRSSRPTAELWHRMTLSDSDASALAAELKLLFARYEKRDTGLGHRFVTFAALAPL